MIEKDAALYQMELRNVGSPSDTWPTFSRSGWAKLTKVETDEVYASGTLASEEIYEYQLDNGMINLKTETNSDGTQRLTETTYAF